MLTQEALLEKAWFLARFRQRPVTLQQPSVGKVTEEDQNRIPVGIPST